MPARKSKTAKTPALSHDRREADELAATVVTQTQTIEVLREVNEQLLISGLREQQRADVLEDEQAHAGVFRDGVKDAAVEADPPR